MAQQKKINQSDSNNDSNSKSSNTKPVRPADEGETTTSSGSSNKPSVNITQYYTEIPRTWGNIPATKPNCLDDSGYAPLTKTAYHQQWPFNSYIDEREEVLQSLFTQLIPPASIVEDVMNKNYIQAVIDSGITPIINIDPVTAAIGKTVFNIGKGLGWWGKKKDDNSDKWNARRPAGCASIAFLQLLYYYKDVAEIRSSFPELSRLSTDYRFKSGQFEKLSYGKYVKLTESDVNDVKSIMEKIGKAIPVSIFTEAGTAVFPIFMKKAAENLQLKEFHEPLSKPSDEKAAEYMYQALCNDIIPLLYIGNIHTEKNKTDEGIEISYTGENCFHYFLVDGCKFDKTAFARTGKYADACKFYINDGWHLINSHTNTYSVSKVDYVIADYESGISKIFFFASKNKRVLIKK